MRYKPRVSTPFGIPTTAERLAIVEAAAVLHREPTRDESLVAVACAQMFAAEIANLDAQIDDYRHQLYLALERNGELAGVLGDVRAQLRDCEARVLDLRRHLG